MKSFRTWLVGVSLLASLAGGVVLCPVAAEAASTVKQVQIPALASALLQFEGATRWEAMTPAWRGRRDGWIARVRAAGSPQQLAALIIEVETIMTWEAMYPRWHQLRAPWLARTGAASTDHEVAQALIALEAATTWNAMFENRWRAARGAWLAGLQGM